MKPQSYKLFAQLCESVVFEASTTGAIINSFPGGPQVLKQLHSEADLGHEQQYKPIAKIAWSELKNSYRGAWVIMQYPEGTGAIKSTGGSYVAAASTGGGVENFSDSRGGNVLDFLKRTLGGNPVKLFVGTDTGKTKELKKSRLAGKQELEKTTIMNQDTLVQKFSPLWTKAMTAAVADIKGMVANMIKNDAFEKAGKKLEQLKRLDAGIMSLEAGESQRPDFLNAAISQAIHLSAHHYYPDETGDISRNYNGYTAQRSDGITHLLQDISAGDQKKLGTILSFFKRALITG
ncbi:MAG: hypothetical protein WCP55_00385 [Lentisphaerota bacterium]